MWRDPRLALLPQDAASRLLAAVLELLQSLQVGVDFVCVGGRAARESPPTGAGCTCLSAVCWGFWLAICWSRWWCIYAACKYVLFVVWLVRGKKVQSVFVVLVSMRRSLRWGLKF